MFWYRCTHGEGGCSVRPVSKSALWTMLSSLTIRTVLPMSPSVLGVLKRPAGRTDLVAARVICVAALHHHQVESPPPAQSKHSSIQRPAYSPGRSIAGRELRSRRLGRRHVQRVVDDDGARVACLQRTIVRSRCITHQPPPNTPAAPAVTLHAPLMYPSAGREVA